MNKREWIVIIAFGIIGLLIGIFIWGDNGSILAYCIIFVSLIFIRYFYQKKRKRPER